MLHIPLGRRHALTLAGLSACSAALAGCAGGSRVMIGQPAQFTPPPPGIDEIHRVQALARTERALRFARAALESARESDISEQVTNPSIDSDDAPTLGTFITGTIATLEMHISNLRTGAENQHHSAPQLMGLPPHEDEPKPLHANLQELASALQDLRDAYLRACLQVSHSLTRLCASAATWCIWALGELRITSAQESIELAFAPAPGEKGAPALEADTEVPPHDPPTEAPLNDFADELTHGQQRYFESSYHLEIIAARAESDKLAAQALRHSQACDARARILAAMAPRIAANPVERHVGYPLGEAYRDTRALMLLYQDILSENASAAIRLTSLAPLALRAQLTAILISCARDLQGLVRTLDPLPGLEARS